jgi:ABC-2 type transport system ATP-binding protein
MLRVTSLTKKFNDLIAVDNVSFSIEKGEILALIGPNSAGKSTIVKSIVGLIKPTKGIILVNGHDVVKDPEQAKGCIGYVPDEPSVWPAMTGKEFLLFTQALYSVEESKRLASIPHLLETFHLEGIEDKAFEEYSRGNRQKFSILSAVAHHPKLLVIDEPIVGLDPIGAKIAKELFVHFKEKGGSVLLVTHTLPVAEEIATRIGFIKNGTVLVIGTLDELRERASLGKDASLEEVYTVLAS